MGLSSRERMLLAIAGEPVDHVPLYCWAFGFEAPPQLRWARNGVERRFWYTMRLEHIHTLPQPWDLEDDFRRVQAWLSLGLDDVLDVSVPWGIDSRVRWRDWQEDATPDRPYGVVAREYETPAGSLLHVVRRDEQPAPPGWVVQPAVVPLFEDYNIPRGVRHILSEPQDLEKLRFVLQPPGSAETAAYRERMETVRRFAQESGVLVQAWSAFGIDGIIWLMGVERAVLAAVEEPEFFAEAVSLVSEVDRARTVLALEVGGIDLVVQRGWYSSTDFWSPALFRRFALPHLRALAELVHQAGRRFAYVMTTGFLAMADMLAEAGVDLLYFVDPVQDQLDLRTAKEKVAGRFAVAGGVNSGITLASGSQAEVQEATLHAVEALGPTGFILAPVDALFPDTPWENVRAMIDAWKETW
jgi:hypothetical protein